MANPLNPLPPDKSFADILAAIQQFPEHAPQVDLSQRINLLQREEHVFIGATWSGKSTLLKQLGIANNPPLPPASTLERYYGVYDDSGQDDDQTIIRTVTAMLKFARNQRHFAPLYRPVILLRKSTWHRISGWFSWLDPRRLGHVAFPTDSYYDMLRVAGAPDWLMHTYLGPKWIAHLQDAHGHMLPKLAWAATREILNQSAITSAKTQSIGVAGVQYIRECPTFEPFLRHLAYVVPEDRRVALHGRPLELTADRLDTRLLSSMRDLPLPNGWTRPQFIEAAKAEGILKRRPQLAYIFARPFGAGLTYHKSILTLTRTHDK